MGVGYVVTINHTSVSIHGRFTYCISNLLPVGVFWQVVKTVLPVITGRYRLGGNLCPVCQEVYRDGSWSNPVLIIIIIPGLRPCNRCLCKLINYFCSCPLRIKVLWCYNHSICQLISFRSRSFLQFIIVTQQSVNSALTSRICCDSSYNLSS